VNSPNILLWSTELGMTPAEPMLAVGDVLLAPTQTSDRQHSTLYAVSLADGSLQWQQSFEYALVSGLQTFRVSETLKVLVALSSTDVMRGEGALLALETAGAVHWRWSPGVQRVSAPAVAGDVVCITADAKTLVALDVATGVERARAELEATASLAAPALVRDVAYIPCRSPHLLAVGLDGKPRWRFDVPDATDAWVDRTPVVIGDRVFAVLSTGAALALLAQDGTLLWQANVGPGKRLSAPATDGERLYVGARDGLHALSLRDGREVWAFPTGREVEAAPVVIGGAVYVTCHDHRVYVLDAVIGRKLWQHEVERRIEVPPVITDPAQPVGACVIVADHGGALTTIARPLSAAEHEAAGRWVEAASAYAGLGQFARGAELLEAHDEPFKAAELWEQTGELKRAALLYQAARAWERAAELWEELDQLLEQAEALEQYAQSLEAGEHSEEERASAWESAARIFETMGQIERAVACQRQVARHRRLPFIQVKVEAPEALRLDEYHEIGFELTNVGGGMARRVYLRHTTSEFAGDLQTSRQLRNVPPGQSVHETLSLRAMKSGSVPLDVSVTYTDSAGRPYEVRHRSLLNVRRPEPAAVVVPWLPRDRKAQNADDAAKWLDLEIRIFGRKDQGYPVEITLGGQQEFCGNLLADVVPWVSSGIPAVDGKRLFEALFADSSLRSAWAEARGKSSRRRIRLRLDPAAIDLHLLPWELLQEGQVMLSAHADTPLSRYLPISLPWGESIEARPIRVLVAISNPSDLIKYDLPPANVALERQALQEAFASVAKADLRANFLDAPVTLERLETELRKGYHVLHFLGHGAFSVKNQQAALYLQDEDGTARRALDDEVAGMLARQGVRPRLVFLAACQSAARSTADAFLGLGPKLVSIGVPAVVAMQDIVTVVTARQFSEVFYRQLLEHGQVDLATNEARSTLLTARRPDAAVPVLFMRLKSG
jgi:outer membrane protein assembly factor BamB